MSFSDSTRWELLTALMMDGFYVVQDYHYVYVNHAFEKLLGAKPGELLGKRFSDFLHPDIRDVAVSRYEDRIEGRPAPRHYEVNILKVDGKSSFDAWLEIDMIKDDDQQPVVAGIVRDISSLNSLKKELFEAKAQLQSIMDNMSDTVYQTDMSGDLTLVSSSVESLLGYKSEDMLGTKLADYYWTPEEREKIVAAIIDGNGKATNVEAILKRKDGTPVWISTNAYVKKNGKGEPVNIEGIARDVTTQKELEQKLENLALTDSLTGLPNRRALMDELHLRFNEARKKQSELGIIYFDVNDFKKVNDQHGHLIGDKLLIHIAITLKNHVSGQSMFGRLSEDEFLFILADHGSEKTRKFVTQLFEDIQSKPLQLHATEIPVSLAIGISGLKAKDSNEYSLLDRADKAMFLAKRGVQKFEIL